MMKSADDDYSLGWQPTVYIGYARCFSFILLIFYANIKQELFFPLIQAQPLFKVDALVLIYSPVWSFEYYYYFYYYFYCGGK